MLRSSGEERGDVVESELVPLAAGPGLAFDHSPNQALGAEHELDGHAEEIGVGEFHPRARLPVVIEDVDAGDVLAGQYTLEVSSPGLERPLRRPGDFARFVGTTISLKSRDAVSGARRHRGVLVEAGDDEVVVEVDGEARRFPYAGISQAKTVFEWGPPEKPGHGKGRKGGGKGEKVLAEERSG